ncbi:MAG: hypothetical protein QGG36_27055, partial [Pirellulaceae bacterium]|nr:hypothetical protein [Pirellulaceae bacterium]
MATNTKFARGCVWLAISIIVVVSLGLLAAGGYFLYRGNQLDAEIARIRAAGDPVELADLGHNSGPLPAPTEDAAALLERAAQPMAAFERELVAAQVFDSPAFKAQTLDEKSAAAIRESLLAFPDLMPLLEQAAKAPHYRTQVDLQLPPDAAMEQLMEKAGNNRAAVRLLDLRARLLALEGEHDEAFQQGLYALRLSRHFSEEPTMVSYLVALAARGIGVSIINRELRCDVSDESRAALHQWLDEQDVAAEFVVALKHERAFGLAKTRTMGPFSGGQSLGYLQAVNGLIASVE